jgi:hypothetical protein
MSNRTRRAPRNKRGRRVQKQRPARTLGQPLAGRPLRIPPGWKYVDTTLSPTSVSTTTQQFTVSSITQGASQGSRIGDTVFLHRMELRLTVTTANADVFNRVRFMIFMWLQDSNYVTPGPGSIVESATSLGINSPYNFEGRRHFKILYDRVFNLSGTATNPTPNSQIVLTQSFNLRERVDYDPGQIAGTNTMWMQMYSDSALTPFPALSFVLRIYYTDV